MSDWRSTFERLMAETEAIRFKPPVEVVDIFRKGLVKESAQLYGQYYTTQVWLACDARMIGFGAVNHLVLLADDPLFELEQLKRLAQVMLSPPADWPGSPG